MQVKTDGIDRFQQRIAGLADDIVVQIAEAVYGEIQAGWSAQSPSEPDEAPAAVSGELAGSITVEPTAGGEVRVGSAVAHGQLLEFGTEVMAARPWLRPAVERVRGRLSDIVRRAIWTR
jgi:hypothetical protein